MSTTLGVIVGFSLGFSVCATLTLSTILILVLRVVRGAVANQKAGKGGG